MIIVNGLLFGLLLVVLIGPVFFSLIQTSISKGFNKAVLVAVGISLSDLTYILLTYFGVSQILESTEVKSTIGLIGGMILLIFGIYTLFKKVKISQIEPGKPIKGFFRFIFKGFLINGLSPFVLVFWLGAMSLATVEYGYEKIDLAVFFGVILVTVLIGDVIKAYAADKLRRFVTVRLIKIINVVAGVALLAFGLRMLMYTW